MIEQASIKTLTSKYNVSGIALYLEVIFFSLRSFANRFHYNE